MPFPKLLFEVYEKFREPQLTHRRFKHSLVKTLLQALPQDFEIQELIKSYEGREIYLVKIGTGKTKLLFWSQMHGDESTATAALFDMFNFFASPLPSLLAEFRATILANCTLYFVPMLNPDGAEVWQRRTAQQIDMNRDALALQTPEARLLKDLQQRLAPDFGFNLHDQNIYYTAGATPNCATISFLAPPPDPQKTVTETRKKAMQVIALLAQDLQQFIPQAVAKFSDDFEPRAFGDNIQRWGTSTILVESGGFAKDPEKQTIRKLNFVLLLQAAHIIAKQTYSQVSLERYAEIPQNEKLLKDLILRNVQLRHSCVDIAFLSAEITHTDTYSGFDCQAQIDDIGDLSIFYGYKELDCRNFVVETSPASENLSDQIIVGANPRLIFRNHNHEIIFKVENGIVEMC